MKFNFASFCGVGVAQCDKFLHPLCFNLLISFSNCFYSFHPFSAYRHSIIAQELNPDLLGERWEMFCEHHHLYAKPALQRTRCGDFAPIPNFAFSQFFFFFFAVFEWVDFRDVEGTGSWASGKFWGARGVLSGRFLAGCTRGIMNWECWAQSCLQIKTLLMLERIFLTSVIFPHCVLGDTRRLSPAKRSLSRQPVINFSAWFVLFSCCMESSYSLFKLKSSVKDVCREIQFSFFTACVIKLKLYPDRVVQIFIAVMTCTYLIT